LGDKLLDSQGNYLFYLKEGSKFPTTSIEPLMSSFEGLKVIYVGRASKSLRKRDYKSHFGNNAGKSTLRKSFGALLRYKQIPRDKNPLSRKTKFCEMDETELTNWMKTNLVMYYTVNADWAVDELQLIKYLNPPLNLKDNHNIENAEFRSWLKHLRKDRQA
jgi:hypothetical protein